MRFRFITNLSLCLFLGLLVLFGYSLFSFGDRDRQEYWTLMKQADPTLLNSSSTPYTAKQQHHRVRKDIWFLQDSQRLKLRLASANAELVLDHHDNQTEVIEKMEDVVCCIQEELYYVMPNGNEIKKLPNGLFMKRKGDPYNPDDLVIVESANLTPKQVIRYLEAKTASYYYQGNRVIAYDVKLSQFIAPGHLLLETWKNLKPTLTGTASSVEFSVAGKDLNFNAENMKAAFYRPQEDF